MDELLEVPTIRRRMEKKLIKKIVKKEDGCWLYNDGRGHKDKRWKMFICIDGNSKRHDVMAHQLAHILWKGPVPDGLCVCHTCDRPACCNPDHLFLGSQQDNLRDMVRKGRQARTRGEINGRCKLTQEEVRDIRNSRERQIDLAAKYGVSKSTICEIQNDKARRYDGQVKAKEEQGGIHETDNRTI